MLRLRKACLWGGETIVQLPDCQRHGPDLPALIVTKVGWDRWRSNAGMASSLMIVCGRKSVKPPWAPDLQLPDPGLLAVGQDPPDVNAQTGPGQPGHQSLRQCQHRLLPSFRRHSTPLLRLRTAL